MYISPFKYFLVSVLNVWGPASKNGKVFNLYCYRFKSTCQPSQLENSTWETKHYPFGPTTGSPLVTLNHERLTWEKKQLFDLKLAMIPNKQHYPIKKNDLGCCSQSNNACLIVLKPLCWNLADGMRQRWNPQAWTNSSGTLRFFVEIWTTWKHSDVADS